MIRMVPSKSAGQAKTYFSDALSKADYYLNDQELQGRFNGRLGVRLGLKGAATREAFFALCENKNPATGKPLTPRTKNDRITGYDINFHCPKSISILHALSKDDHILKAFEASVVETMLDIEKEAKTRVRKDGVYEDRITGEFVWAEFTHQTARPVEDHLPDPHLHCHCFVFNATWDETEKKIKAAKFRDIKRDMPYYQARFHKRLADKMVVLGYRVKANDKSFEIEGVPQPVIEYFSKRTDQIGQVAKEKGITNKKQLDALGAKTRSKKQKGLSMHDLKSAWRLHIKTLTNELNIDSDKAIRFSSTEQKENVNAAKCIDHAIGHCFERASVMKDRRILETAYKYALGQCNVSLDEVTTEFESDNRILRIEQDGGVSLCTTKEVLSEEKRMIELARHSIDKLSPLYVVPPHLSNDLDTKQKTAVSHIVTTTNRVSIIRGAAGSGKTTMMKEAVELIEHAGKTVTMVAPTASASRGVLKDEGFEKAETVAKLFADRKMQEALHQQVLIVDEAGLLGTKDMVRLLEITTEKQARLILVGDTRQHASVVRGDALRILNTVGGIKTAEVDNIHRQKDYEYREAVKHLSQGNIGDGFNKLDKMGAIKNIDPLNPNDDLVNDYIATIRQRRSALVISPTHAQGDAVTDAIRKKLRQSGKIGKKEIEATRYINLNFTDAQKNDKRNYEEGQAIQFNQNSKKIKRGSLWFVKHVKDDAITIENEEQETTYLPEYRSGAFDVYRKNNIKLSKGDRIRITRNGFTKKRKRLNNGDMLNIKRVTKAGRIVLFNEKSGTEYILDKNFGHLAHAHCVTSHASQGKTVDEVFISQPASTFGATDAKQFYVSVSRGRYAARIYTDDREELLMAAMELGDRQSAIELVKQKGKHLDHVLQKQQGEYQVSPPSISKTKEIKKTSIGKDYEPDF